MAASPMNDQGSSYVQVLNNQLKTPYPLQADVTIAIPPPSKTYTPPPPAPFTPITKTSVKRKRLKPSKYEFPSNNAEKKRSPSKLKAKLDLAQISPIMIRAKEVQSSLGTDHPSFIKIMLRSHVVSCFWMGLPVPFCKSFLPKQDTLVVIEGENGQQYNLKYIAYRTGLSAGWRNFAIVHKLLEGDVLIFQLVASCKFKVSIVRSNGSKQIDGARDLLNHNALKKQKARAKMVYKRIQSPAQRSDLKVNSEAEGASHKPDVPLKNVKTFKTFPIMVNKQCIDSELSEEIRMGYYKLCNEKKELIHDNLPEGLYYKLVVGMIGETVNIAKAIKNCKPTTTKEEFDTWDSSLKSFELMGMKVGFLRKRIRILEKLAYDSEAAKKYAEANEARQRNGISIKSLEAKIVDLKESNRKIDAILGSLKENVERSEIVFQEKVNEPW